MFTKSQILHSGRFIASIFGGWWGLMSGALSIPFALAALIFHGHERIIFALLAFFTLWICVLIMACKNYPKFKLFCHKGIQGCAVTNDDQTMKFFRVRVETSCMNGIEGCLGHLTMIVKNNVIVFDHESRELPFAPSNTDDSLAKTIFPDTPYYLDVLAIHCPTKTIYIATKGGCVSKDKNGNYVFGGSGEYILHVNVTGKGVATASVKLKFDWRGDWATATMEKFIEP